MTFLGGTVKRVRENEAEAGEDGPSPQVTVHSPAFLYPQGLCLCLGQVLSLLSYTMVRQSTQLWEIREQL